MKDCKLFCGGHYCQTILYFDGFATYLFFFERIDKIYNKHKRMLNVECTEENNK